MQTVIDAAEECFRSYSDARVALGFEPPPRVPIDPGEVAVLLHGLHVEGVPGLRHDGRKYVGWLDTLAREIRYEATDVPGRVNLTVAHEIGHWELHRREPGVPIPMSPGTNIPLDAASGRFYRCTEEDANAAELPDQNGEWQGYARQAARERQHRQREWEAFLFGRQLLMPPAEIRDAMYRGLRAPKTLATYLHVSVRALQVQCAVHGIRLGEMDALPW